MADRRRTSKSLYLLAIAALCFTVLQWLIHVDSKWKLHRFDRKGIVWQNHTGEVLFLSARGDELSGYRLSPKHNTVSIRSVTVTYQDPETIAFKPDQGKGNLFKDLRDSSTQ